MASTFQSRLNSYYVLLQYLHPVGFVPIRNVSVSCYQPMPSINTSVFVPSRILHSDLANFVQKYVYALLKEKQPRAKIMGPSRSPPGSSRPQMDHMLAPRILLSGKVWRNEVCAIRYQWRWANNRRILALRERTYHPISERNRKTLHPLQEVRIYPIEC